MDQNIVSNNQTLRTLSRNKIFAELQKSENDIKMGKVYKADTVVKKIRHRLYSR